MARSLWLDPLTLPTRAALNGDLDVDTAIVGGGFTGLWTAYYLKKLDPTRSVLVIERDHVGFGASGRNGGWVVGELAAGFDAYAERSGHDAAMRLTRAVFDSVDEIGRIVASEGINCGYAKGGTIRWARNDAQARRQVEEIEHEHRLGFTEEDFRLLSADDARAIGNATDVRSGIFFAHTAAVDPARLVVGLAAACEAAGVVIVERTAAASIDTGAVVTDRGTVRAAHVVRAVEGYTRDIDGERRRLLPVYSRMIATEPLSADRWDEIGLVDRSTFADDRYMVIYGQRTEDDRIAFGGRGIPYLFGSAIDPAGEVSESSHAKVERALRELFPALDGVEITHRWGGVLGIPRNWMPFVHHDADAGVLTAGGYVGEGVSPANLAGRTMAELIVGVESERVDLPWVKELPRRWEPEPLRWLGVRGSYRLMARADQIENRGKESKLGMALANLVRGG